MPIETVPGVLFARLPEAASQPLVFDSPHSGFDYPPDFQPSAPRAALLTTCDRFVDELWGAAAVHGATLIGALFPRAYVDPNRAASDLDPELLAEEWPGPIEKSDYTRRGMGLIRRFALPGVPMYSRKLYGAEIEHRLEAYYRPYRNRLAHALDRTMDTHGAVLHCNCHSMKPQGNAMNVDVGRKRSDFVLSDRNGLTAGPSIVAWFSEQLRDRGYSVSHNDPYQGGDLVATFGRPNEGRHSLQIEINRGLYLDPATCEKSGGFPRLQDDLRSLFGALADFVKSELRRT